MSSLKYSCADFTFPLLTHKSALQIIKLLGISAVDLGVFEDRAHLYPSIIAKNPIKEGKKLNKILNEIDLIASDVFLQTGADPSVAAANTPNPEVKANNRYIFHKMLEFTNTLKCKHLTGLPGVLHDNENFEDDWKRACEEAEWRTETAKSNGITYSIEPHVGSILPDVETTMKFINDVPDITLTLDYGHFIYQGEKSRSVHKLIPHATHFHARGGASGQLQTTIKDSEINFSDIASRLKTAKYNGYVCMEYVYVDWEGCNRTDNISETVQLYNLMKNS